jgi:hypothetical protein
MKGIDELPRTILIMIAKKFGHRTPEDQSNQHLVEFISNSI